MISTVEELLANEQTIVDRLEALVDRLDRLPADLDAIAFVHQLASAVAARQHGSLSLKEVSVPGSQRPIKLLLHPAVFSPEHWGKTFAEGLLKDPERFAGSRVVELGCGSGWISLLLLLRTRVKEIVGLDINRVAVVLSRFNAWLNGSEPDGTLILSQFGIAITKAFSASVSDLLSKPLSDEAQFEHVIGCIPQVLHPNPEAGERKPERLSDRDLYDLSNYCFQQGILEDRFGLPLIARTLEQAQLCLKPGGKVTLVLGGRPGPVAIESMFRRRGFEPALLWSRRIRQADDTDLASLVALERQHGIEFNFFMSRDSGLPISASTAVNLLARGEFIYHDLLVYQASTRWEMPTFGLIKHLHLLQLDTLRQELDLSRVNEEQISFLERLSSDLLRTRTLSYPHERGDLELRERLSRFLKVYCHWFVEPERLFAAPERAQLLKMILSMVTTAGSKVLVSHCLLPVYHDVLSGHGLEIIVGNDDLSELMQLDDLLSPALVLISPRQLDNPSPTLLSALSAQAGKHGDRWYLIDDSAHFDIGSQLNSNAFVRLASQQRLPANLVLLYGLIRNTVFPDLELSFLLNAPEKWSPGLEVGAELTYSRIARPTQLYYEWLFDGLLDFAFPEEEVSAPISGPAETPELSATFMLTASDPVFDAKPVSLLEPDLIRLDYGEFEYPLPDLLVKGLIKGFLEAPMDGLPALMAARISAYLQSTRAVEVSPERLVLGQGVFPLLGAVVRLLKEMLGRKPKVALPDGSYGPCYPLVLEHGGLVERIPTEPSGGFLMSLEDLRRMDSQPDLLWLTQPNNPSGLFYAPETVRALGQYCQQSGIYILADEVFFLLSDSKQGDWTDPALSFASSSAASHLFLTDGLSKAFAAGGLRCGFLLAPDAGLARRLQSFVQLPPKSTLRTWDAIYSAFLEQPAHQLMDIDREKESVSSYLLAARRQLSEQRERLMNLLRRYELDDGQSTGERGGLFVLAKLAERADDLLRRENLLVNPPAWGRTSGWVRLCFSLTPERFEVALRRLERYLSGA